MILQVILEGLGRGLFWFWSVPWVSARGLLGWCIFTVWRCSSGAGGNYNSTVT